MNDKVKKAPTLRVYPIQHGQNLRYIEAANPAAAVTFCFKPNIGEPLTAMQVLAVIREKGADKIEVATAATKPE